MPRRWGLFHQPGSRSRPIGSGRRRVGVRSQIPCPPWEIGQSCPCRGHASRRRRDSTQLFDVHVHQLARAFSFVTHRGGLRGANQVSGHRVTVPQIGHIAASQHPRHRAGRHAQLSANRLWAAALNPTQCHDLVLDCVGGAGGHGVWSRRTITQAGFTFGVMPRDPRPDTLSGNTHRRGDVSLRPTIGEPLDDQPSAMESGAGITAPLCVKASDCRLYGDGSAGPVSDWSEVPAKGCEPAALDDRAAPLCPAGPAPIGGVASCTSCR